MNELRTRALRRARRTARLSWGRATWRIRPAPDFVIIGAQRCGTTTLLRDLLQHPQVIPAVTKEIHYFDLDHGRGAGWYRAHFPTRGELDRGRRRNGIAVTGEATPNYLFHPHAARWARHELPNTRFIVLLRDPVDRAYSQWKLMTRSGFETRSFEAALDAEEERTRLDRVRLRSDPTHRATNFLRYSYLARGRYADQLEEWFRHHGRDRLLVLGTDDLRHHHGDAYDRIVEFLGLAPWRPSEFSHLHRTSGPPLDARIRTRLVDAFQPHNERLADLLGIDPGWHPPGREAVPVRQPAPVG